SDPDQGAGSEVFRVSYDSLADFMSDDFASRGFSQLDIAGSFSMGGFAAQRAPQQVPEPGGAILLALGATMIAMRLRRRRH
ncbi:MAG: PEP-CTERM sorting domain-containing protein, partial [Planctomycetota bacterium]